MSKINNIKVKDCKKELQRRIDNIKVNLDDGKRGEEQRERIEAYEDDIEYLNTKDIDLLIIEYKPRIMRFEAHSIES